MYLALYCEQIILKIACMTQFISTSIYRHNAYSNFIFASKKCIFFFFRYMWQKYTHRFEKNATISFT